MDLLCPGTPDVVSSRSANGNLRREHKYFISFDFHAYSRIECPRDAGYALPNTGKGRLECVLIALDPFTFAKERLAVYGSEGKLDSRYLSATQSVLRDIAHVTEQLNNSFNLYTNGSMSGTSRISAHLYIFQHQVWHL